MANAEEAVNFEPEEDDLMDEDVEGSSPRAAIPKLKSAITGGSSSASKKIKGHGFREETTEAKRNARLSAPFDSLDSQASPGPEQWLCNIEYENFEEAERAINEMDGNELLTQTIHIDWAFSKGPFRRRNARRRHVRTSIHASGPMDS